jgi:hypothetical protein
MTDRSELDELENKLADALEAQQRNQYEIDQLTNALKRVRTEVDLPTEPGWYLNSKDQICRLSPEGYWDDGWGQGGWAYGNAEYDLPLRKLVVESE